MHLLRELAIRFIATCIKWAPMPKVTGRPVTVDEIARIHPRSVQKRLASQGGKLLAVGILTRGTPAGVEVMIETHPFGHCLKLGSERLVDSHGFVDPVTGTVEADHLCWRRCVD